MILQCINFDGFVKSRILPLFVIPIKMGIQYFQTVTQFMDSRLRGNDIVVAVSKIVQRPQRNEAAFFCIIL